MRLLKQIIPALCLAFCTNSLHAVKWSEGKILPETQAIVKTVSEIMEKAPHPTQNIPQDIQTTSLSPNFTAATYADSGVVPPDAMGAIGPAQFLLAANGRVRSFNKKTGLEDHVMDISTDAFFSPVSNGSFTTDSRIRYDKFSDRWYIVILAATANPIRIMLAVSDTGILTANSKWNFFHFEPRKEEAPDYPTLGIDKHSLYIGLNIMSKNGYLTSDACVIPKEPLLAGTLKCYLFQNIVDPNPKTYEGPTTPQGVDNFDNDAQEGYFIGIDGLQDRLILRRIRDPGGHPTISDNLPISIPNASFPLNVPQKGSNLSKEFFLQGFDKRLCNSHVRDKLLYTAHNVGVNNLGASVGITPTRDGCMWYEINLADPESPAITQTGTLFQPSRKNDLEERYYWMPGIMTNGLHSLLMACNTSGDRAYANAAFAIRYSDDPLGTLRPPQKYTKSHAVYTLGNPPFKVLRWGEDSQASVDPLDDMTFWSIAEFALSYNSWGLQVVRIPAPPPAKIISIAPAVIEENQKWVHLTITGERNNGSAFYDPGESYPKRLKVEIKDVKIISLKWINPTRIDLIVSTGEASHKQFKEVKITNPDGQIAEAKNMLQVVPKDGDYRSHNYRPRNPEDLQTQLQMEAE